MYIHNESDRRIVCIYTYVRSHFLSKLTHRSGGTIRKGRTSPSTTIHTKKNENNHSKQWTKHVLFFLFFSLCLSWNPNAGAEGRPPAYTLPTITG